MRRFLLCLLLPLALAACGAEPKWAPDDAVQRAAYSTGNPPSITLFTVINNRSDEGAHSGLMIDGSQRIMFDPAGTWWHRTVPERNDVHYGITNGVLEYYVDYHARETYRVVMQTIPVSPAVAEQAMRAVQAYGAVPKAMCGNSVSAILRTLPGFGSIPQTYFPKKIMNAFGTLPGVHERVIYDHDDDDNSALLATQTSTLPPAQ